MLPPTGQNIERRTGGGGLSLRIGGNNSVQTGIFRYQAIEFQNIGIVAFAGAVVIARQDLVVLEPLHVQIGSRNFAFKAGCLAN